MVEDQVGKEQFILLKPCCVELLKERSLFSITKLQHTIESMSSIVPPLLEYVIFPLQMTLQHSISSDTHLTEGTLHCMRKLFQSSQLTSQKTFYDTLTVLCAMLESPSAPVDAQHSLYKGIGSSSEELLGQVLLTLQYLILQSDRSIVELFHKKLVVVGHTVSLLISILESVSSRLNKEQCINTLISLTYCNSDHWKELSVASNDFCTSFGNGMGSVTFASFLPGISVALCNVMLKDSHVGQVVIRLCLIAMAHFISLVLNNSQYESTVTVSDDNKKQDIDNGQLTVTQDASWWTSTDGNLEKLLNRFLSFVNHENWKVRLTLGQCVTGILHNCHKSLSVSCGPALEVLVTLSLDEYSNVSSFITSSLELLYLLLNSNNSLTCLLEERLYHLSSSLPRLIRGENENNKLVLLKLLQGYLELLKSHVSQLTCSPPHMNRLLQALIQTVELQRGGPFLMENKTNGSISSDSIHDDWVLPLSFSHIRDDNTAKTVQKICRLIGCYGNSYVIIDLLLQQIIGSQLHLSEYLLIFHWILIGMEPDPSLLSQVIEGVLELWEEIDKNLVYGICLILCIIGEVAVKLNRDFSIHLQYILGVVMATMTSNNVMVSLTAVNIANTIAIHTGHHNTIELIIDCADYIINTVHHHLMYPLSVPHGCHILQAVINHGILPLLTDCKDALLLSVDQRQCLNECWSVCLTLAKKLPDWVSMETSVDSSSEVDKMEEQVENDVERENISLDNISKYFMEYHRKKEEEARKMLENEDHIEDETDGQASEDSSRADTTDTTSSTDSTGYCSTIAIIGQPLPPAVQCCIDILQRCIHHISSNDSSLRLCTLDCVCHCLTALQYREKELLPEVHNIWAAFLYRLTDSHLPVRIKAIDVLVVMAKVSKEFLRKRVIDQIWPKLVLSLEQLLQSSKQATPTYHYSMEYKLLMKILSTVAELCSKLNVSVANSEEIARSIIMYLSKDVHHSVQTQCVQTCRTLASFDEDMMWLLMVQICPNLLPPLPHPSLKPIKLPHCTTTDMYKNNISLVFPHN